MSQNKKTNIISVIAIIFIIGGLVAVSRISNSKNKEINPVNNQGEITTEENSFDFGTISMAVGKVSHSFKVKNNSASPVKITKIYTSCMCTTATYIKGDKKMGPFGMPGHGVVPKINQLVEPGAEAVIEVVFDPAAHGPAGVGRIERVVYIEGETNLLAQFNVSANVTP